MPTTDEAPSLIVAPIKAHELTVHMLVATADEKLPVQSITDYNMGPARLRRVQYGMPGGVTSEVVLGWNQPITVAYIGAPLTTEPEPEVEQLTEEQAHTLFCSYRERFGWSGTVFMRADVENAVRVALTGAEDDDDPVAQGADPAEVAALVARVMDDYTYRKLADRFAELGNELLDDAARIAMAEERDARRNAVPSE